MRDADFRKWITWVTKGVNRAFGSQKASGGYSFDANTTTRSLTITVTTHGRPVFVIATGDLNPTSAGAWFHLDIYRDSTILASQTCQSTASSVNVPFSMAYLDTPAAGTYTYKVDFVRGTGEFTLSEGLSGESPSFIAFEI